MSSRALRQWATTRAGSLGRLRDAREAVAGRGLGRRWLTKELDHAVILRVASEFQGFARDLHDEAIAFVSAELAPGNAALQVTLSLPYTAKRELNYKNANPDALTRDFGLLGIKLWPSLYQRYPSRGPAWREKLRLLNAARNGIAHQEPSKIAQVQAAGWPLTLPSADRWRSALDGLTRGMDVVVAAELRLIYGASPW
jgi:hypothetical protein